MAKPQEEELTEKVDGFVTYLKQKNRLHSSYDVAKRTVLLMREICSKTKWASADELMYRMRVAGKKLVEAQPSENAVGNMVRRVLKITREEHASCIGESEDLDIKDSLHTLLHGEVDQSNFSKPVLNLKGSVIETMNELLDELEGGASNIASQALDHIHSSEVIMTAGYSKTVEAFLKAAARKRKFEVIVAESAPSYQGQELATKLAQDGIQTTVITDSAVFAIMSRVNKVIIGTHTVMADGGLKALNGAHQLALAAKHHSIPVLVCAALFKFSPEYLCSYDQDTFNKIVAPHDVLSFTDGEFVSKVHVQNPVFDFVPPDLITLFISNIGGSAPSYIYRLISDLYHADDKDL
ncbi:translation initiation factor eIF2B subunit beta-like [Halichondria panicea]|uniref:translation initiation factor eIF2B subunit beta-like n=1 Tax=Halichondria panicea TaxID=6063 RepID=UPI00312BAE64